MNRDTRDLTKLMADHSKVLVVMVIVHLMSVPILMLSVPDLSGDGKPGVILHKMMQP